MSETMHHLLDKLPKEALIDTILLAYKNLFPDLQERKEAFRTMALLIQAREVTLGNVSIEDFDDPFKTDLQAKVEELREAGVK